MSFSAACQSKTATRSNSLVKNIFVPVLFIAVFSFSANAQLGLSKLVGKNSDNAKLGYNVFANWDIPLTDIGNRSVVIELMDFVYYPQKNSDLESVIGYLSIKAGYKYIFSEENRTGFYVEPSAGYCIVVRSDDPDGKSKNGLALATEAGYSLEVGQNRNAFNFGLKYEADLAGGDHSISSLAFRVAFSFHLFKKRGG